MVLAPFPQKCHTLSAPMSLEKNFLENFDTTQFIEEVFEDEIEHVALPKFKRIKRAKLDPDKNYITKEEVEILRQIRDQEGGPVTVDPFSLTLKTDAEHRYLKLFKLTVNYGGNIKRAMEELGWAPHTVKNPGQIVKSKTWKGIMNHYFPSDLLAQKNMELLEHKDWRAVNAALDRLHKLRGDFTEKLQIHVTHGEEYRQLTDEDLQNIVDGEIMDKVTQLPASVVDSQSTTQPSPDEPQTQEE
jgi:hypothetical protein